MRNGLFFPLGFVNYLIRIQELKTYNAYVVLAFCTFTALVRGIEEILLFSIQLKNSEVVLFVQFYMGIAIVLSAGIAGIGRIPWPKVASVILVGIFLGIFPPLLDFLLGGGASVFYGFFFVHDLQSLPWLGYKPEFNFPLGECITIWLSIFFAGYYVYYKSGSLIRMLATWALSYICFMIFGSLLPMLVAYLVAGSIPTLEAARRLDDAVLRSIVYYNGFAQMALAAIVYLLVRRQLLAHLVTRSLHTLPFVALVFLGAAIAGKTNGHTVLAAVVIFWAGWLTLLQNRFYDASDDRRKNSDEITEQDVVLFNLLFLLALLALFFTAQRYVLSVLLTFPLAFLYNHSLYRGKKKFPTNLKIEGMWGFAAFLTGAFSANAPLPSSLPLLSFLVFGGFSLVASLKDGKDVRNDYRSATQTLYVILLRRGVRLRQAHRGIFLSTLLAFLIPPAYLLFRGYYFYALSLALWTGFWGAVFGWRYPGSRWFGWFLFFTSSYLLALILITEREPQLWR
jgi:hypothetical protein